MTKKTQLHSERSSLGSTAPSISRSLFTRAFSFFIDWAVWGYVSYAVMYFLNYYWYTQMAEHWYDTLTLPVWGWIVTVVATLELTVACRSFGHSLGCHSFGFQLRSLQGGPVSLRQRFSRYLKWHASVLLVGIGFWGNVKTPWHDRSSQLTLSTKKERETQGADNQYQPRPKHFFATQWGAIAILLIAITIFLGYLIVEVDFPVLAERAHHAGNLWKQILDPDFRYLTSSDPDFELRRLSFSIVDQVVITLFMTLIATLLGTLLAFPLSFLGARNIMGFNMLGWSIYSLVRGFFNVFRAVETLLWVAIFAVWVGRSPFAGVLALMIHTIAALGKLFSERVESIDPGPVEAITAVGGSRWQIIRHAVIPQVAPSFWAFTLYRWDINMRMSTIIALVGGGGIGTLLFYYKRMRTYDLMGAVVLAIVVIVWLMDYISGRVRERIT